MRPLATQSIWMESFQELVIRWFSRQTEALKADIGGAPEAALRAEQRAEKVLFYAKLKPQRALKTAREWEARWNPEDGWNLLTGRLSTLGWDAVREKSAANDNQVTQSALRTSERQVVLLAESALAEQVERAKARGLLIPLTTDDLAVLNLARESFLIFTGKMGNAPKPWVEELAQHAFAQRLLGLPFNTLVFSLLDN